jgi:hypothetical protein
MAETVITALATASEFAAEVAVTVTARSLAGGAGAVYVIGTLLRLEEAEMLPHGGAEQDMFQVTPRLFVSFTSVAISATCWFPIKVGVAGSTVIPTEGTSRLAVADFVPSVAETPVSVTVVLLAGGVAGAVKVVLGPLVGETVPHPGEHALPFSVSDQLRLPPAGSLLTLPLIGNDAATCTVALTGERETERAGMVIVALADLLGSAAALALRVTVKSLAGGPGAV